MSKIVNKREYALEIAATGQVVEAGDEVEIDDREHPGLADSLLEQEDSWGPAGKARSRGTQDDAAPADDEAPDGAGEEH